MTFTAVDWLAWGAEVAAEVAVIATAQKANGPGHDSGPLSRTISGAVGIHGPSGPTRPTIITSRLPVKAIFTALLCADVWTRLVKALVLDATPHPFAGAARALYHVETGLVTAWPVAVAALAWSVFRGPGWHLRRGEESNLTPRVERGIPPSGAALSTNVVTDSAKIKAQKTNGPQGLPYEPSSCCMGLPLADNASPEEDAVTGGATAQPLASPGLEPGFHASRNLLTLPLLVKSQRSDGSRVVPREPPGELPSLCSDSSSESAETPTAQGPDFPCRADSRWLSRQRPTTRHLADCSLLRNRIHTLPPPVKAIFALWLVFNALLIAAHPLPRGWTQPTLHAFDVTCVVLGATAIVMGWARRQEYAAQVAGYLVVVEGVVAMVGPWAGNVFTQWRTVGAGMYAVAFSLLAAWQWWQARHH